MEYLSNLEQLAEIYGPPMPTSLSKVSDHLTPLYSRWIAAARLVILSTVGPGGTDGTPRGDDGPVVREADKNTLLMPDWTGNNRNDSLRNIIRDDRLSLMFMVNGCNNVVRVNGTGKITADAAMCASFKKGEKQPKTVLVITVQEVYFQCAKALMRADLWSGKVATGIPTAGDFIKAMTAGKEGGHAYDAAYDARARRQLWER